MRKWFISDTHFSHANIIKYENRPFSCIEEMDKILIENWNKCVGDEDQVFFLGDFGMGSGDHLKSICSQLKGHKVCLRGNHDGSPSKMYNIGFYLVLESLFIKIGRHIVELVHIPSEIFPIHFQLHGHVHGKRPSKLINRQLNMCVEVWKYNPVEESIIIGILDRENK